MDELSIEHKRTWVKGLLIECPMGTAADNCPARDLRTMPIPKRLIAVDSMTDEQVEEVVVFHKQCLKRREAP
ncbi:MAG: hypothetical protein QGH60_03500 [Phycisphaerae bacterium]|jgi:hypothetical protein|nr:hypothetical protein [Phycisphaerae bacterium]